MPATWAELRDCLAALLDHFASAVSAIRDVDRVMSEADRWQGLAADLPPLPPADAEQTELLGLLRRLGPTLADLDAPLQQLLHGPSDLLNSTGSQLSPAFLIFLAALKSGRAALVVAQRAGATADDLLQLGCSTRLLLGTGRLVAAWATEVVQLDPSPADARLLFSHVIAGQLYVLTALISTMSHGGLVQASAAQVLPPQALLAWLRAVVAVQQSMSLSPYEQSTGMGPGIGLLTEGLCLGETLEAHRKALAADAALCSSLVGMLLRSLGKAAVALRLPPDRRPALIAWDPVQGLAKLLVSPTLRPALDQHIQQADGRALLALVQQAATVLQHLPSAPTAGCPLRAHVHAQTASIGLLSVLATEASKRAEPVCTQAVQPLLPTLPQLAAALQLAASLGDGVLATKLCGCWTSVLTVMLQAVYQRGSGTPTPEQLLAAATVMLCALPTAATCAQQLASPGQTVAQAKGQQSVIAVGQILVGTARTLLMEAQPGEGDAQLMAAAHEAHEACCRAIHWATTSPEALLLPPRGERSRRALALGPLKALLGMLGLTGNLVAKADHGLEGEPAALSRAVQGTCAAHWAAVQAAMAAGGASLLQMNHPMELTTLAITLFFCAKAGPMAVGSSPELLALIDQQLRSLPAGLPDEDSHLLLTSLLRDAWSAPRLASHLVASGTLEAVASGLPSRAGTDRTSALQMLLMGAAVGPLEQVQHAGAAKLGDADASSALAQALKQLQVSVDQLKAAATASVSGDSLQPQRLRAALLQALPVAAQVAAALQAHWQRADAEPERHQAARLELAQAAATRASCAHLACPNVGATGQRGKLCTGCRVARYCCRSCSVADWRAGHRVACSQLAAARAEEAAAKAAAAE